MIKVSKLEGALLDYWVAKAEGIEARMYDSGCFFMKRGRDILYRPSADWTKGGPIIERENILFDSLPDNGHRAYKREIDGNPVFITDDWYTTKLIQAMRCYVASKFGDEVPDEP